MPSPSLFFGGSGPTPRASPWLPPPSWIRPTACGTKSRHFWNISPRLRAGLGPTAELLDRTLRITEYRYIERFTAAVSKSGGDAQATGAQGAHVPSGRVLVDIEEADGVQLATYNALEGSMSSANAKMVMQFNPLRRSGPAYNATRSRPVGDAAHQRVRQPQLGRRERRDPDGALRRQPRRPLVRRRVPQRA